MIFVQKMKLHLLACLDLPLLHEFRTDATQSVGLLSRICQHETFHDTGLAKFSHYVVMYHNT